ncbi:MAG: flagellar biosynthetic protein FliO [Oscillospiraceae bacterium]|nr:flagellar biosynthetic protein FliO [Oscillospiraceae bacterium]
MPFEIALLIVSLLGVVGLIFLTYYGVRWLNKKVPASGGRSIKVLERAPIAQDKSLVIVKVGEKHMLLGLSPQHIEKIADLDAGDIVAMQESEFEAGNFKEILKKNFLEHQFIKPLLSRKGQGEQKNEDEKGNP